MVTPNIFSVAGKRVCITGAAGGIGMACALGFIQHGAIVAGVTRSPDTVWHSELESHTNFHPLRCNLAHREEVAMLPEQLKKTLRGPVDVLVHAAWACPQSPAYSIENFDATIQVGLTTAFMLYGAIAPVMAQAGGGCIISIGSINGTQAFPNNPAYTATKAALQLLTKTIARDFGLQAVRANNLCPGYVKTRMTEKSFRDAELNAERTNRTMLGRWADPEEIVGPCLFLASDAASYVTGADLFVDGGWTAKGM